MRIINRQARFKYHILDAIEAGIVLSGQEVKSIRSGRIDLSQSFARIQNNEVFLKNAYIPPYSGAVSSYDPKRDRKLLLHHQQINSLIGKLSGSATTLVPLSIYIKRNLIKLELGVAVPKKKYDHKRQTKEKDEQKRLEQELKSVY